MNTPLSDTEGASRVGFRYMTLSVFPLHGPSSVSEPGALRRATSWVVASRLLIVLAVAQAFGCTQATAPSVHAGGVTLSSSTPVAEELELRADSATSIRGWFVPGRDRAGAVLLLHGHRSSHRSMLGRARFLHRAGYSVLLIDFRGHGRSSGGPVTLGAMESRDAHAALAYLRQRLPNDRVAVIGASMGGAASLLGPRPIDADAFILESVYATINDAVRGRARTWLGPLGSAIAPVYLRHWLPRSGVGAAQLRPIERIGQLKAPVYVMSGTDDRYTSLAEARALFERVSGPREFWAVAGAGHQDLYGVAGPEYERRVLAFLDRYVRSASPPSRTVSRRRAPSRQ